MNHTRTIRQICYILPSCRILRCLSHLRVYVSLIQQLPGFYEMHLALGGGHRGRQDEAIQAPRVPERHHAVLRPTPAVRDLLLVELVAKDMDDIRRFASQLVS